MGSVKDLDIAEPASETKSGLGYFTFSDRYSVFDWGEMPDQIENKGRSLTAMAAFNFEGLERRGIRTHYKALVTSEGSPVSFEHLREMSDSPNVMAVEMAVVYHPIERPFTVDGESRIEYDYSFFEANRGGIGNFLIPLEIIFRNGLPLGSSVFKKIEKAKVIEDAAERERALKRIYQGLGLTEEPKPGDMLPRPVMNYTTKLEASDRSLSEDEAYKISGLTVEDFMKVAPLALKVNEFITEQAEKTGVSPHWDGKVEMRGFHGLGIVDVVGTLDENRFGNLVSKEFLRQWYKKNHPEFVAACEEWSQTGAGWQERCPVKPRNLPPEVSTLVSQMYMAGSNRYTQSEIFDAPPLEEVMDRVEQLR